MHSTYRADALSSTLPLDVPAQRGVFLIPPYREKGDRGGEEGTADQRKEPHYRDNPCCERVESGPGLITSGGVGSADSRRVLFTITLIFLFTNEGLRLGIYQEVTEEGYE